MLLAAGLGTRLRPLTLHTPKALVPVAGVPMLERIAEHLIAAGADRLIVNTHHLAEQVEAYVAEREGWGIEVRFSQEQPEVLETGGGLLAAAPLFRRDEPFLLHNADILTDLPLAELYAAHRNDGTALATLATLERPSSRYLLFDDDGLFGRVDEGRDLELRARPQRGELRRLAFAGVHAISPRIFDLMVERGAFSILEPYLRLAAAGERIVPYRVDGSVWLDIGTPEQLAAAERHFGG